MTETIKSVAVLTSGGDAPGMNAAIRSVVRTGLALGWKAYGVEHGYQGLIDEKFIPMTSRSVSGIIGEGGTLLGSARCLEFKTEEGRQKAVDNLRKHGIDALVVIGGNGSQTGSAMLHRMGFPVVGVASTIDNDLYGSDITIGVDTALDVALENIDRLKVTASSHHRAFLVEVMGRDCGYLALMTAIAGGAEAVCIPEVPFNPEILAQEIAISYERGKKHCIVIVAEGATYNAEQLVDYFRQNKSDTGFDLRATTLGHIQRGGTPGAFDRVLATRLAAGAVEALESGLRGVLSGHIKGEVAYTDLETVIANKKPLDLKLYKLASVLAE